MLTDTLCSRRVEYYVSAREDLPGPSTPISQPSTSTLITPGTDEQRIEDPAAFTHSLNLGARAKELDTCPLVPPIGLESHQRTSYASKKRRKLSQ